MTPKAAAWICPTCKRTFARANQAHSCQVVPLSEHLKKTSKEVGEIYKALVARIRENGPLQVAPTKTGVNLLSRTSLGSVRFGKAHLDIGFVLTRKLSSSRVRSSLQLSPRSVMHSIRVTTIAEVDDELAGWLAESYQVGMMAGRR